MLFCTSVITLLILCYEERAEVGLVWGQGEKKLRKITMTWVREKWC